MKGRSFLTAEWRKLIMAQYAVDPAALAAHVPRGTELDLFAGQCFVSLVGFLFQRVRLKGTPIPFHTRFDEVNLRFYVRVRERDGSLRRGVVFLSEFVPRTAITLVANAFYEEPYATCPMRHRLEHGEDRLEVEYSWRRYGRWHRLGVEAHPVAAPIGDGSVEEFITEHYWGFTRRRDGTTSQYEVRHPRWNVYPVQRTTVEVDFRAVYGERFAGLSLREPDGVLLAEGSAIEVLSGSRLEQR